MKFTDYKKKMESNPEYVKAREELAIHFELGRAMIHARIQKGWSQQDLADAVGTKQANISRIEAGLANPTISLVQKILKQLDLKLRISHAGVSSPAYQQAEKIAQFTEMIDVSNSWPGGMECSAAFDTSSRSTAQIEEYLK
jgi:ribosome-binding protein aMBF1 (putative translation factor)